MATPPDFPIISTGIISTCFTRMGILSFAGAAKYVQTLRYGRNTDKDNPLIIFADECGTCSTKHALLKRLASENNFEQLDLIMGIFAMNPHNSPEIAAVLQLYGLPCIPEAHNYFRYNGAIFDYTFPSHKKLDFSTALFTETVITPNQIGTYKISFHKLFMEDWLKDNPAILYSPDELWNIRESCISLLSG